MGLLVIATTVFFLWAMGAWVDRMDIPEDHKTKVLVAGFLPVVFLGLVAAEEWRLAIIPG